MIDLTSRMMNLRDLMEDLSKVLLDFATAFDKHSYKLIYRLASQIETIAIKTSAGRLYYISRTYQKLYLR